MNVETKLMTADELLAMPDDGAHRYELVRGELSTMSPAGARHGKIAARLLLSLASHVRGNKLGEVYPSDTGFVLSSAPDTVRAPDVAFVTAARAVDTPAYFPGAPDLAVEVVSPNDTFREIETKVREYLSAGTRLVIVVEPSLRVAKMHTQHGPVDLTIDDSLTGDDVVPGWSLPLRDLFDAE